VPGSPPFPLYYSNISSTSDGKEGAFCSPPPPLFFFFSSAAGGTGIVPHVEPVNIKVNVLPFLTRRAARGRSPYSSARAPAVGTPHRLTPAPQMRRRGRRGAPCLATCLPRPTITSSPARLQVAARMACSTRCDRRRPASGDHQQQGTRPSFPRIASPISYCWLWAVD
jgi:hypothetical protein